VQPSCTLHDILLEYQWQSFPDVLVAGQMVDAIAGDGPAIAAVSEFQAGVGFVRGPAGGTTVHRLVFFDYSGRLLDHFYPSISDFTDDIMPEKQQEIAD
jgi:hypothetical protein